MLAGLGLEEATFEISPGVAQAHTTGCGVTIDSIVCTSKTVLHE